MQKENYLQPSNESNKKILFQKLLEQLFISLKRGDNEFANLADNENIFPQLKNFGKFLNL